jgi:hypothetical protein
VLGLHDDNHADYPSNLHRTESPARLIRHFLRKDESSSQGVTISIEQDL